MTDGNMQKNESANYIFQRNQIGVTFANV